MLPWLRSQALPLKGKRPRLRDDRMAFLLIVAIIFFYIITYGGTVVFGGLGIWLFVNQLKTRDEQKCFAVAAIVGLVSYGLLVAIPSWLFQFQLDRMPGQPMQNMEAMFNTPLGKFMMFSSFLGTGLSIFFAGWSTRFVPHKTVDKRQYFETFDPSRMPVQTRK